MLTRFATVPLALGCLLAACKSSTGPSADPHTIAGTWNASVGAASGCWPAFTFTFVVADSDIDDDIANNAPNLIIPDGRWSIGATSGLLYTGTIWDNGGTTTLKFWKTFPTADGSVTASLSHDFTTFSGTFLDEGNAFSIASGCTASFSATK